MVSCAVKSCKNYSNKKSLKGKSITYHMFPNDEYTKEQWIEAVGREDWAPDANTKMCSVHFTEDCFDITTKGRRLLFPSSVPTLFLTETFHTAPSYMPAEMSKSRDSSSVKALKSDLERAKKLCEKRRVDIKRLTSRNFKLKKKVSSLEKVLKELMQKFIALRKKIPGSTPLINPKKELKDMLSS